MSSKNTPKTDDKNAHTPGPWQIGKTDATALRVYAPHGQTTRSDLATVKLYGTGADAAIDEAEANARLIAAAPEMLEALRWAIPALVNHTGRGCKITDEAFARIEAAIAKATGGAL